MLQEEMTWTKDEPPQRMIPRTARGFKPGLLRRLACAVGAHDWSRFLTLVDGRFWQDCECCPHGRWVDFPH